SPCRRAPAWARSRPAGRPRPPGPPPQRRAQTYAFSEDLPVEMRRHPDVGDGADEKGNHQDPRRPVDLAFEAAPRAVAAPDVAPEERRQLVHERAVLVGVALDRQLALAVGDEPGPAAAELPDGGLLQLFLELVIAAERALDRIGDASAGIAPAARPHDRPE